MDDGFDSEVWTEKYRPKKFEDMVLFTVSQDIVTFLPVCVRVLE